MAAKFSTAAAVRAVRSCLPDLTGVSRDAPLIETLRQRRDFLAAARARKAVTKGMIVQKRRRRADESDCDLRIGFTASKKVGNAVKRNLAKRRMRMLAREVLYADGEAGCDYVLIARAGLTIERDYQALRGDLEYAIRKLRDAPA